MLFQTERNGTHYILVSHGWFDVGGTYDLSVIDHGVETISEIGRGDFPANQNTPGRVSVDSSVTGKLVLKDENNNVINDPADYYEHYDPDEDEYNFPADFEEDDGDCFSINLEAGERYGFFISEPNDMGTHDVYLQIHYSDMSVANPGTYQDLGSRTGLFLIPPESGTYYLCVRSPLEYPSLTDEQVEIFKNGDRSSLNLEGPVDDYVIAVESVPENWGTKSVSEPPGEDFRLQNTALGPGFVLAGDCVTGNIEYRDPNNIPHNSSEFDGDSFNTLLRAGQRYQIDLKGADSNSGTLADPYFSGIYVYGELKKGVTNEDDGEGKDELLQISAKLGRYGNLNHHTFLVRGAGGGTGTYTLCLTKIIDDDDFPPDSSTEGRVTVDGSVTGDIEESGDWDWFKVDFVKDTRYRIDLKGAETGVGTLTNPIFYGIYKPDGTTFVPNSDDDKSGMGNDSRKIYTADETGTYFLVAGAKGQRTGTYTLTVMEQ